MKLIEHCKSKTMFDIEKYIYKNRKTNKEDDEWDSLVEDVLATDTKIQIPDDIYLENSFIDDAELEKKITYDIINDYRICPNCNLYCRICDISIICEKCGLERPWDAHNNEGYSATVDQNYNTSSNSFIPFNIVGMGSYCYQRSLMKSCADTEQHRTNTNKKEIVNYIYQYEGHKPPHNVINTAAELFDKILKKGYKYRESKRKGILGACLYYASIMHNLTKTPKEIASIMRIDEKFVSQGDKFLQELNEFGIIEIPTNHEPLSDYINQYFPSLGIPLEYKKFVIDLIARAEIKKLHIQHETRTTTKCIGVIYLLTKRVPTLKHIKKETISSECNNISKATFLKYYKLIINNGRVLKKVFKKHGIKMPKEWRGL